MLFRSLLFFCTAVALPLAVSAQTAIYLASAGSGDQSGSSPANALPFSAFWTTIDSVSPGSTIRLLAGDYSATGSHRIRPQGTPEQPVIIEAADGEVTLYGNYALTDGKSGDVLFLLRRGNLIIRDIKIRNVRAAFGVDKRYFVENVTLENIGIDDVSECVNLDTSSTDLRAGAGWLITGLWCTDYYRVGIRIDNGIGEMSRDITIRHMYGNPCIDRASVAGAGASDFVAGVQVGGGAHDIAIENSAFENNRGGCHSAGAVNGDGIATEDGSETYNVTISNVAIYGSGDSGVDIKTAGTVVKNATVSGARHSYKMWYHDDFVCDGCSSDYARDSHIQPKDGGLARFRNSQIWCRGNYTDQPDGLSERVINSTLSSGVSADSGAILENVIVFGMSYCEQDPEFNFKGELNDLSGLIEQPMH